MSRERWGTVGLVGLWGVAIGVFIGSATRGLTAVRVGQVISGFCIIMAGSLLALDWMGTATAMGRRTASRWRKRLDIAETRDPAVNARATRLVAGWWVVFGALVVLFGVAGHS